MTEETGIESTVYGMGLAVSDFNRDGKPDLLVTGFGVDEFWVSGPDGKYQDQAGNLGLDDDRWTTSAAFVDIDRDGDEDLYVCSYVDFRLENHKPCFGSTSLIDYCGPSSYPSLTDRFYLNDGAGGFADWTEESGIGAHEGAGLGVASSDLDGNGLLDFYVANDGEVNRLWLQVETLTFRDSALLNGCALNREGQAEASMGAEIADYDGDGNDDVILKEFVVADTLRYECGNIDCKGCAPFEPTCDPRAVDREAESCPQPHVQVSRDASGNPIPCIGATADARCWLVAAKSSCSSRVRSYSSTMFSAVMPM